MKDYYKVLNIDSQATQEEIRKAYIKLMIENHPDNNNGNEEKASEITEAYSILSKPEKRKKYDEVYNDIYGIKMPQKNDSTVLYEITIDINYDSKDSDVLTSFTGSKED